MDLRDVMDPENVMHHTLEVGVRRLPTTNTNFNQPLDANADSQVSALDALLILNRLDQRATSDSVASVWVGAEQSSDLFLDTNADFSLTALDALIVINHLNRIHAETELQTSIVGFAEESDDEITPRNANVDASISSLF
jgi:hypothetical protein